MTGEWRVRILRNELPRITSGMERLAGDLVAKAAHDIERGAKLRAPVDTGFLRNSIQASQVGPTSWKVIVGAEYGLYVEWGTARRPATPYVRPAVTEVSPNFFAAMRQIVRAA